MKLYAINYKGDTKLNRYVEMLMENGMLVEVVPNYQAAEDALSEYEGYVIDVHTGHARSPVRMAREEARLIVDAALQEDRDEAPDA
jgi:hypothetical protein